VADKFKYSNLTANGTTVCRTGGGILHSVTLNDAGASANVLTLYDNTAGSGTTIATIDTTEAKACFIFDAGFDTGLTAVLATGTAANVTITYS